MVDDWGLSEINDNGEVDSVLSIIEKANTILWYHTLETWDLIGKRKGYSAICTGFKKQKFESVTLEQPKIFKLKKAFDKGAFFPQYYSTYW